MKTLSDTHVREVSRCPSPVTIWQTLLTRLLDQHYGLTLNDTPFADERVIEQHIEAGISLCDAAVSYTHLDPSRFLFVLSHADRMFPAEEWNATEKCPSRHQELSLATVTARVATLFPSSFPVQMCIRDSH